MFLSSAASSSIRKYPARPNKGKSTNISGYVTHAQLLVGGTAVKDYYDTAFPSHPAAGPNVALGTNQSSATLAVSFDRTHFADGTNVPTQMVAMTTIKPLSANIRGNECLRSCVLSLSKVITHKRIEEFGHFMLKVKTNAPLPVPAACSPS